MRFWRGLLFFLCLKCTQGANMNLKKKHVLLFIAKTTEMKFSNKFAKKFYIIKNQILISNYMQAFLFGFLKTISWATVLDFSDRIQWRKKDQHKVYMYHIYYCLGLCYPILLLNECHWFAVNKTNWIS